MKRGFILYSMYLKCSEPFRDLEWKWIFNSLVILGELVHIGIDSGAVFIRYCEVLGCTEILVVYN